MKSSAADSGSFDPTYQFEKHEIHPVFRRFPNFNLCQNLSLTTLADFIIASLMVLILGSIPRAGKMIPDEFFVESSQIFFWRGGAQTVFDSIFSKESNFSNFF